MRIFVINLEKNLKRRASVESSFKALNLDFEFFPGIDGNNLSAEDLSLVQTVDNLYLPTAGKRRVLVKDKMTNAEIGCALAHLRLYQHILDLGLEQACILEDDSIPNEHFVEAINNIDKITEPWDIINFTNYIGFKNWWFAKKYHFGAEPKDFKRQYFQRVGLWNPTLDAIFNPRRFLSMCACYVVSRQACEKLIKIGYPIRLTADYLTGLLAYNHFRLFKVYPDQLFYVDYTKLGSDINERSVAQTGVRPKHHIERA